MKSISLLSIGFLCINAAFCQYAEPDAGIWVEPWSSCEKKANPKAEYGKTHWIQYNLGDVQNLSKSRVWNVNDPKKLNQGFKNVKIDYSMDGQNWTYFGEMTFPKAEGQAIYGGFQGPDLVGVSARYILLTAVSNHGDSKCSGLTEVKFNLLPTRVASTYEERDDDDKDKDENKCKTSGTVILKDGNKIELSDFDPHHSSRDGYTIETNNGWVDIGFNEIDKVYISHIEGNQYNYDVRTNAGKSVKGFSNVFRNFVDGKIADANKTIEYSEIDYFTITTCD
ncbi:MAG: discoidin domain-containing protein [Bacteroidetes bacterium]|nr:discoidin domain-containing protein [Bacteroidota bacterium]